MSPSHPNSSAFQFISGEYRRRLDDRFRLSIPKEFVEPLQGGQGGSVLTKERSGCVSLWNTDQWKERIESGLKLIESKIQAGRLEGRIDQVQALGRLLSTRHKTVPISERGRLLIPEGFREFLGVEPGGEVMIIGAALCVEIWRPEAWIQYLEERMPEFRRLLDELSA